MTPDVLFDFVSQFVFAVTPILLIAVAWVELRERKRRIEDRWLGRQHPGDSVDREGSRE